MEWIFTGEGWVALLTLTALEVVLGIDNIIFISILSQNLPADRQPRARFIGLAIAMITRVGLLFSISWIMSLSSGLFAVAGQEISGRDIILILGGLFLLAKSTSEIHKKLEGASEAHRTAGKASFGSIITQIVLIDIVFSLDSVITAVGMVKELSIMITAVVIAVLFMMVFAGPVSRFVETHPTIKILALSFLLLIGVTLMAEGFDQHISKGYIYFAMAFSVFVEMLNLRLRSGQTDPVRLRSTMPAER